MESGSEGGEGGEEVSSSEIAAKYCKSYQRIPMTVEMVINHDGGAATHGQLAVGRP